MNQQTIPGPTRPASPASELEWRVGEHLIQPFLNCRPRTRRGTALVVNLRTSWPLRGPLEVCLAESDPPAEERLVCAAEPFLARLDPDNLTCTSVHLWRRRKLATCVSIQRSDTHPHPEACHHSNFRVRSHSSRRAVETTTAAIWLGRVGDRDRRRQAVVFRAFGRPPTTRPNASCLRVACGDHLDRHIESAPTNQVRKRWINASVK